MSAHRGPCNFRKRDLQVAVDVLVKAGREIVLTEIDPTTGKIVIHTGKPQETANEDKGGNEWDRD